jgi:hypothetical protein
MKKRQAKKNFKNANKWKVVHGGPICISSELEQDTQNNDIIVTDGVITFSGGGLDDVAKVMREHIRTDAQ